MHAITVSVADKMRPLLYYGGITDPRKAWLTLRGTYKKCIFFFSSHTD